jgi:hypothetical protein
LISEITLHLRLNGKRDIFKKELTIKIVEENKNVDVFKKDTND